jgi:hypothetical protein
MAIGTLAGGCVQIGPKVLSAGRPLYNIAVQETESQQLLLNIVRQRYSDPIMFLDVTSISSGFNWQASTSILGNLNRSASDTVTGSLGASVSETPFITYSPNTGEKFVRQMLTPIDVRTVALIVQAGWSIERVLMIIGASINQVRNDPTAADPDFGSASYQQVVSALRDLQRSGVMTVGAEPVEGSDDPGLMLIVDPEAINSDAYRAVCTSIKVACEGTKLRLRQAIGAANDGHTMALATRSLFSALYFLAQGVEVPSSDLERGNASSLTPTESVEKIRDQLFRVRSSASEPKHAAVKIFYRNNWFYIADNDPDSKTTFALVSMLVMLQSGETAKITPLITLPMG